MDTLRATYDDTDNSSNTTTTNAVPDPPEIPSTATADAEIEEPPTNTKNSPIASDDLSDLDPKDDSPKPSSSSSEPDVVVLPDEDDLNPPPHKKQKHLSELPDPDPLSPIPIQPTHNAAVTSASSKKKKSKSKNNNVWTKPTSRKGKKKNKSNTITTNTKTVEDTVLISPVPRFPDKNDDSADAKICLSKVYKAEKVELSEDRMSAGSCKGYRMVRATRGVMEGAWYFEIKVLKLGETGHTRLGWSNEKGDLQAPVGYDGNSFGYRDVDGSKVHKALREKYGEEGYVEGDVIGFYICLPEGNAYAPKPPRLVWHKGQRYVLAPDANEDPPKVVPATKLGDDDVLHVFLKEREVDGDFITKVSDIIWLGEVSKYVDSEASIRTDATQFLEKPPGDEDEGGFLKLTKTSEWLSGGNLAPVNRKPTAKELHNDSERRKKLNLLKYEALKRELFLLTASIGTACSGYCLVTLSVQAAASYATGVLFSCLYLQLLCQHVDSLSKENVPQVFMRKKTKKIGIRSEDLEDLLERMVKGSSMALSSSRLVIPAAIYGLWELSQHFANDIFDFKLVPAMVGIFAYKAAALVQVYRDNENLELIFPDGE